MLQEIKNRNDKIDEQIFDFKAITCLQNKIHIDMIRLKEILASWLK